MYNLIDCNRSGHAFDLVGSFFDNIYKPVIPSISIKERSYAPLVDIYEKENDFFVEAQLPGMEKNDVKIEIDNGKLFISAEKCKENEIKEDNYYRKEIARGKFVRSFALPDNVDEDKLDANFKDGILKIKIPKIEAAKPRQIVIN